MRIFLLFFVITLMMGCSSFSKNDLPEGIIKYASLDKKKLLEPKSYAIEKCDKTDRDGQIKIQNKYFQSQTFSFCINEQYSSSLYILDISQDENKVCRIKESGDCENELCYSVAVKGQCFELKNSHSLRSFGRAKNVRPF